MHRSDRHYTLKEWQVLYDRCPIPAQYDVANLQFLLTRIEYTRFAESARTFGKISLNGHVYHYVQAVAGDGGDGGEMIVRDDFMKWVKEHGHALVEAERRKDAPVQPELF